MTVCSRPEDGLRYRQGVKPPLKLKLIWRFSGSLGVGGGGGGGVAGGFGIFFWGGGAPGGIQSGTFRGSFFYKNPAIAIATFGVGFYGTPPPDFSALAPPPFRIYRIHIPDDHLCNIDLILRAFES